MINGACQSCSIALRTASVIALVEGEELASLTPNGSPECGMAARSVKFFVQAAAELFCECRLIEKLKEEMQRLELLKGKMLVTPDQQISLTDPDARSMATSGRGSGIVGYNVQIAVEAEHHLIVTHEVTNDGTDRSQLAHVAKKTKTTLDVEKLDAVADRGYFNSEEILACEEAGITVTLPKPMTSQRRQGSTAGHIRPTTVMQAISAAASCPVEAAGRAGLRLYRLN